ncbi:MAG: Ribulose-phosphate 3-epimerase [Ignavibacteriae bacterium]|nr:MAG: Ribulose-phosphate 3-epimerase [Ignavibacteriota bacterium]
MNKQRKVLIAPSILSANFANLKEQISIVERAGADWLHLDIMDGNFVPNITFGPMVIEAIRPITKLPLDAHLMILNPERYIEQFYHAGVDILTVHVETCPHLHRTIQEIKSYNIKAGVTLNPATPASLLVEIIPYVDLILVMTVNPGFGGQKFIDKMLEKINTISRIRDNFNRDALIEVDGGINTKNAKQVFDAGADVLVAGNSIFKSKDIAKALKEIRKSTSR